MAQPLWKTVWRFLKLTIELACYPAILFLGIYPEKIKKNPLNLKTYIHSSVYSSTMYGSLQVGTTQVPINDWFKKMWYVYTMEYYLAIRKK